MLYVAKGINFSGGEENDIESEMVTFALPNTKPADITPPPEGDHPLVNNTWYFLERGQSDGDGNESNDYSRVWCDTVRFEDGNVYYSNRTVENKTECTSEADELVGTYSIEGNSLVAAYAEDGEIFNITYDVTNDYDSNEISQGAVTLLQTEDGESSRYTWFKSEFDAEKRIQVASSDNSDVRDAAIYWPSSQEDTFKLISTTLQMDVANGSGNSHDYIKVWMNGISCDGLFEGQDGDEAIFDSFRVTFDDNHNGIYANSNSCFTAYEDGTPNAVISFLFGLGNNNRLELDETYSIMGKISDGSSNWSHYITDISFNMTWDGVSNDE